MDLSSLRSKANLCFGQEKPSCQFALFTLSAGCELPEKQGTEEWKGSEWMG